MHPRSIAACLLFAMAAVGHAEVGPAARDVTGRRNVADVATQVDRYMEAYWKANGVTPAPQADDAEFLRRLSLDLIGRIPTAAEARSFVDSREPDKRTKKIDELLARPGYITHFATVFRRAWIPQATENPEFQGVGGPFEGWLRSQLRDNRPMDAIVRDVITVPTLFARGRPINDFGRDSPFAFVQVNEFKPENVAAAASRLFMGVKIECAQCHNHPFAPYKKEQFWEQAAFFAEVQPVIANLNDARFKREIRIPETSKTVQARYFNDGQSPAWDDKKSPRETFADWLTSPRNPYFARNMVNRTWAHFLGHGLVEPIDEPADDNPPAVPEVIDLLSKVVVDMKYDPKFLIRVVTRTRAYQLTSRKTHESQADPKRFARMAVKAMTGEQVFDSLATATGYIDPTPLSQRLNSFGPRQQFLQKFSSSEKLTDKPTSILQALTLMNGSFVNDQTSLNRSEFLAGVIDAPFLDTAGKVEVLVLATLGRKPTPAEASKFESYVERGGSSGDKKKAVGDLFWALLNTSEFLLNH